MDDNCVAMLCDPDSLRVAQAVGLARVVSRCEPHLATSLGAYICHLADTAESDPRTMRRALEVLCAITEARTFAGICQKAEENGHPVTGAMVRWLAAGVERRMTRMPAVMEPRI